MESIINEHNKLMNKTLSIGIIGNNIANEDFSSFIKGISNFFSSKLQTISNLFSSNANERLNKFKDKKLNAFATELLENENYLTIIEELDYTKIRKASMPTVIGLTTNFVDASSNLATHLSLIKEHLFKQLDDYDIDIAKAISDDDYKNSTRPIPFNHKSKDLLDKLDKNLQKVFNPKLIKDSNEIEKLYPNLKSFRVVFDTLLSNGDFVTLDNMKKMEEKIKSIVEKINILVEQMKEKNYTISKEVLKHLTKDTELCANLVTTSISYIHWYNQMVMCLNRTIEMLGKR